MAFNDAAGSEVLTAWVGTVASSGNSITFATGVDCTGTGKGIYCSSAFDPTTGRVIIVYQDKNSATAGEHGSKFQIGHISTGTFAWHTGATSNSNMISYDMFGGHTTVTDHDIVSIGDSKWLYVCTMTPTVGSFTAYNLYGQIINAGTSTTAAPTYANSSPIHINLLARQSKVLEC